MPRRNPNRATLLVEDNDDEEFFSPRHLVIQQYFRDWIWEKCKDSLGNCCVCDESFASVLLNFLWVVLLPVSFPFTDFFRCKI